MPSVTSSTDSLIEFLRSREAYPHTSEEVVEVQTHISWVFLAGDFVYKVKKPVSLGFLDFSTLEKRRYFCEEEVRLNKRLCSDLYLGVVAISESDGRFALDDESNVIEYAVKMRRLQGGAFGDELCRSGAFDKSEIDRVIGVLASFYRDVSPSAERAAWGRIEKLRISTDENFEQIEPFAGRLISRPALEAIRYYTDRFYSAHARLLNERRADGRIVNGHGDLHLEHVYLTPDRLCIYDCIEFNERFRWVDVANDVAFLAMDMDFNDRPHLARYFGKSMAQHLHDPGLLRLLDFYKCYRAVVRGKVEGMRSRGEEVPEEERDKSIERAERFFQLALRYAVAGSHPAAIIIMGRIGTGKSTVAKHVSEALGWQLFSSDRVRKDLAGVDPYTRGSEEERQLLYSAKRSRQTYEALVARARGELTDGRSVVIDATYSKRDDRETLRDALREGNHEYVFLEMTADDETIRARLRERDRNGRHVSDARLEDFDELSATYEAPDDLEEALHVRIPSGDPLESTINKAFKHLIRLDLGR